jgi:hypothetical protein
MSAKNEHRRRHTPTIPIRVTPVLGHGSGAARASWYFRPGAQNPYPQYVRRWLRWVRAVKVVEIESRSFLDTGLMPPALALLYTELEQLHG